MSDKSPEDLLARYLSEWGLSLVSKLTSTPTSHLYRVVKGTENAVLKVFTELGKKAEGDDAAYALRCYGGKGAVRLLDADNGAHLLEWIEGTDLSVIVLESHDNEATEIAAQVVSKLHTADSSQFTHGFHSLERRFRSLFDRHGSHFLNQVYNRGDKIVRQLIKTQGKAILLHGDLHHQNILHSERGWIAIDPQPLLGEAAYDLANFFYNPTAQTALSMSADRALAMATTFSSTLSLDRDRVLQFAFSHGALSACWSLEDGEDPSRTLKIAEVIGCLI